MDALSTPAGTNDLQRLVGVQRVVAEIAGVPGCSLPDGSSASPFSALAQARAEALTLDAAAIGGRGVRLLMASPDGPGRRAAAARLADELALSIRDLAALG